MIDPEQRLRDLGHRLPAAHPVVATYDLATRVGPLLYLSGHGPFVDGRPWHLGTLGTDVSVADGAAAAQVTMLNILRTIHDATGDLDRIERFVKLTVFVASAPSFAEQHLVANGATDLLVSVFGDRGRPTRSAIGVAALPLGFCVEIEGVVEVAPA